MNHQQLNAAYDAYKHDPDKAHELFMLCLAIAKRQVSVWAWGHDSHFDRDSIAQEATIAAWLSLDTFRPDRIFSFWFLAVVRNKCNDAIRLRCSRNEEALSSDYSGDSEWKTSYDRLIEAAGGNGELIDCLMQDYDLDAASGQLGITTGAVKQRLQRIKAKARKVVN